MTEPQIHNGKVRDTYIFPDKRVIVTSNRVSAFDFHLGEIPQKGAILNQIAAYWFDILSAEGIPHHLLDVPHPQVSVTKNLKIIPLEIVVRGYLTGSTTTSSWYAYQNTNQTICGIKMPDKMVKNQRFDVPIITPTTKPEHGHDLPISESEILEQKIVTPELWTEIKKLASNLFKIGQSVARSKNLILVDTKYEFGLDENGILTVADEIHTPDSSRYWIRDTYESNMAAGIEPDNFDKEFIRRLIVDAGYNVDDSSQDPSKFFTDELAQAASAKYIQIYESFTGESFTQSLHNITETEIQKIILENK